MPAVIQHHRKQVVETRLKKFYSTVNQAINMSETKYGDKRFWLEYDAYEERRQAIGGSLRDSSNSKLNSSGRAGERNSDKLSGGGIPIERPDYTNQKWIDKYLAPNMSIVKREEIVPKKMILLYFKDGSGLSHDGSLSDGLGWVFYPSNPKKCIEKYGVHVDGMGICKFSFYFGPERSELPFHYNKGMEPYKIRWNGDIKSLFDDERLGCNENSQYKFYCTALIQANGWKIPENYPFKF